MFFHNLKYSLKCLFKNKGLIFWTFVFPIILGTFYKLAFSNIESAEKLDTVDIAVIESETSKIYTEVLNNIDTTENMPDTFTLSNLTTGNETTKYIIRAK